jgi:hypothetical protein
MKLPQVRPTRSTQRGTFRRVLTTDLILIAEVSAWLESWAAAIGLRLLFCVGDLAGAPHDVVVTLVVRVLIDLQGLLYCVLVPAWMRMTVDIVVGPNKEGYYLSLAHSASICWGATCVFPGCAHANAVFFSFHLPRAFLVLLDEVVQIIATMRARKEPGQGLDETRAAPDDFVVWVVRVLRRHDMEHVPKYGSEVSRIFCSPVSWVSLRGDTFPSGGWGTLCQIQGGVAPNEAVAARRWAPQMPRSLRGNTRRKCAEKQRHSAHHGIDGKR